MMRRFLPLLLLALPAAGCVRPLTVAATDRVTIQGPVHLHANLNSPPVVDAGPVVEVPVGGASCPKGPKVAVVDVDGLLVNTDLAGPYSLGENPVALFHEKLAAAAADPDVCAVVVRINSPGGGVTASDMMWRELQAFRTATHRPVVACLMDVGAGGAYYLATASDWIVAHPTTVTGGIGCVLNLFNLADVMGYFNVHYQGVKAGPNIDMGSFTEAVPGPAKELLQAMADEFHGRFKQVVTQARPRLDAAGGTTFDGRIFTGPQALQRGLVDQVGYLDDALTAARQMAGQQQAGVVLYRRCNDPAHSPFAVSANVPVVGSSALGLSIPGLERSRLPSFLYLWQPDPTLERAAGK